MTALFLVALTGCGTVGPDFSARSLAQPSRFAFSLDPAVVEAANEAWWESLRDPVLNDLITRALVQNLDLESARFRLEEAQALLGTVGLQAQVSEDMSVGTTYARGEVGDWQRTNAAQYQPAFVINLFGADQREPESAVAQVEAEEFRRPAIRLAIISEIVRSYNDLRQKEAELEVRRAAIRTQTDIVANLKNRLAVGEAQTVSLRRAEAELASARALIPSVRADRGILAARLATLLAEPVEQILDDVKDRHAKQLVPTQKIDPGIPASLLKNRPDIRSAEASYASAVADIGVAEAQLYPSLRISGSIRIASNSSVSLGPSLSLPVLSRGPLKARAKAARARAEQARITWEKTVLSAGEEVETALVLMSQAERQVQLLKESVAAHDEAARLSRDAFALGSLTVGEILEVELNSSSAKINLTAAKRTYANAWAQLNVAMGMGWRQNESAEDLTVAAAQP